MSRLIEGNLVTKILGAPFRLVEIVIRSAQLMVRGSRLLVQRTLAARVDAWLANVGKRRIARDTNVDNRSIVMLAMQGEYTCNPKYIAEEILRRGLPYEITWVLRDWSIGPFPESFRFVAHGTTPYFQALARAKIVIQNGHTVQISGAHKGANQYWLQTWHGSLGLKRLEGAGGDPGFYERMRHLDNTQTDLVFTNSRFEEQVFTNTYWPDVEKPMLGHARNDLLFDRSFETASTLRRRVLDRLSIVDRGQNFLLYAPTHNDNAGSNPLSGIDIPALRSMLAQKFDGEWEVLIRTHHSDKMESDPLLAGLPASCHNASFYPDMQELLVVADAGISDFSSWVCDYILANKPVFLFSSNLEAYSNSRGFYHDFADTPFTMATSNALLLQDIENFNQETYDRKIVAFLERCESVEDGMSAARIVDRIERLMQS